MSVLPAVLSFINWSTLSPTIEAALKVSKKQIVKSFFTITAGKNAQLPPDWYAWTGLKKAEPSKRRILLYRSDSERIFFDVAWCCVKQKGLEGGVFCEPVPYKIYCQWNETVCWLNLALPLHCSSLRLREKWRHSDNNVFYWLIYKIIKMFQVWSEDIQEVVY